jgi:hypothetical protein
MPHFGGPSASTTPSKGAKGGAAYAPKGSEQNWIHMWSDTALAVDKLLANDTGAGVVTDTELDLRQGRITGNVKKLAAGSNYEVKYKDGVAAIRGTTYDMTITVSQGGVTTTVNCTLVVVNGSAVLSYTPYGSTTPVTVSISPGQDFSTAIQAMLPPGVAQATIDQVQGIIIGITSGPPITAPTRIVTPVPIVYISPTG